MSEKINLETKNMSEINSQDYVKFVKSTTSPASSDLKTLIGRMNELSEGGVELTHLLTFALGATSELGEAVEIIKKCLLQGKAFDDDAKTHLTKELSDVLYYIGQFCIAMDISFEGIMTVNYDKLRARYPEGKFSVYRSENRKPGDL